MHTGQIILIEAKDHENARSEVYSRIHNPDYESAPSWSDWSEVGPSTESSFAGRWAGDDILGGKADLDTLRYSDDPDHADRVIGEYLKLRQDHIDRLRQELTRQEAQDILFTHNYDPTDENFYHANLYTAKSLVDLLNDEWKPKSMIYDLAIWDANLREFYKRVETNPDEQFLVVVDFHH